MLAVNVHLFNVLMKKSLDIKLVLFKSVKSIDISTHLRKLGDQRMFDLNRKLSDSILTREILEHTSQFGYRHKEPSEKLNPAIRDR